MAAYRGWSGGTDGTSSNTTGTAASEGTITIIQNNDFTIVVLTDDGSISFSAPTGYTQRESVASVSGSHYGCAISDKLIASAGRGLCNQWPNAERKCELDGRAGWIASGTVTGKQDVVE
jgi:hypothetical protein